jgi:hypothetical protein
MKLEQNLVRKGFEALYFKTFQIQTLTSLTSTWYLASFSSPNTFMFIP